MIYRLYEIFKIYGVKKKKNYFWKKNFFIIEFIYYDMFLIRVRNKIFWNVYWIWIFLVLGFLLKGIVRLK